MLLRVNGQLNTPCSQSVLFLSFKSELVRVHCGGEENFEK
jgi:hypothetical protein